MQPILFFVLGAIASWFVQNYINQSLNQLEQNIMPKLSELAAALSVLTNKVTKIHLEILALKDSLQDVDIPPEAQAALDNLTASLQAVDDLNPDAS